ncbi:MAG: hypothetical protein J6Y78_12995 [Paludibacteraceae bacterium]|nr:hypothetical protein [Paludibacteraceae bacterium]
MKSINFYPIINNFKKEKKVIKLGCKHKALYVKVCVIQCNVADYHNDILDATDIKKIFTSFNNQDNFEVYHNEIPLEGVSLLENYISSNDEVIADTTVPAGSWNAVIRVDNPTIQKQLLNGDFGGVSLNNRVETRCSTGLEGAITYSQLSDAECVIPIYISFVDDPANLVGLHIMSYDVYIQKSKMENKKDMSLLEDLKALINKAEEEDESSAEIEKDAEPTVADSDEPVEEEVTQDDDETTEEETTEEEDDEEVVVVAEDEKKLEEEEIVEDSEDSEEAPKVEKDATEEEPVEETAEEVVEEFDVEAEILALKEQIETLKAEIEELKTEESVDETAIAEDPIDEPVITKSAKINMVETEPTVADFYKRTGRDPVTGMRIKTKSRILN